VRPPYVAAFEMGSTDAPVYGVLGLVPVRRTLPAGAQPGPGVTPAADALRNRRDPLSGVPGWKSDMARVLRAVEAVDRSRGIFQHPVDPAAAPDYGDVILRPVCLDQIRARLLKPNEVRRPYQDAGQVVAALRTMLRNW